MSKGEGPPPIEPRDLLITCLHIVTWQIKNEIPLLSRGLQLPNLTEWWLMTRGGATTQKTAWTFHNVLTWGHVAYKKQYISTSTITPATRLDRVVAYDKGSPPKGSCDMFTCGHVTNKKICLFLRGLQQPNLTRWCLLTRGYYPKCYMNLSLRCHLESLNK